jgi:hypothetical protein
VHKQGNSQLDEVYRVPLLFFNKVTNGDKLKLTKRLNYQVQVAYAISLLLRSYYN